MLKKITIFIFVLFSIVPVAVSGEEAGIDMVVVLDQSGSIRENLPVVKEYVRKSIFGKINGYRVSLWGIL